MRRISAAIISVLLVLSVFAGCNNQDNETTAPEETSAGAYQQDTPMDGNAVNNNETVTQQSEAVSGVQSEINTTGESITGNENEGVPVETAPAENVTQTPADNQEAAPSQSSQQTPSQQTPSQNTVPSAPSQGSAQSVPASSEYEIIRSGNFYIKGYMIENNGVKSPLEMAVTPDSVYMLSEFSENVDIGMLVKDEKMYMIYPKEKMYLEMNDAIMSMAGLSVEDMVGSQAVDFTSFKPLTEAYNVIDETVNGVPCRVYSIKDDDGEVRVYLSGKKLVRFASYSPEGQFLTATEVDSISGNVPADKSTPPTNYKKYKGMTGMFSFMAVLEDEM